MTVSHKKIECRHALEKATHLSKYKCTYRVNPYVGCTFGCLYCSKSMYREYDPGQVDSQEPILVKINAMEILKNELKKARSGLVCICGYQPLESEERIIRQILDALAARAFPVHIISRSEVLLDDMDVLRRAAENNFCSVSMCINTMDKTISQIFEPNTPPPKVRMNVFDKWGKAGITTGLAMMPVIPYITDSDEQLEELIGMAAEKKARYVLFDTLRLEDDYRASVIKTIKRHYPELLVKYRRLYEFGAAPESMYPRRLRSRIRQLLAKYGLEEGIPYHDAHSKSKQVNLETYQSK